MWGASHEKIEAIVPQDLKIPLEIAYLNSVPLIKGDSISIKELSDPESLGKIEKIFWECNSGHVKLLIRWYYKPKDIQNEILKNICSNIEVFLSDAFMEIELLTVNYKVRVLGLDEVIQMDEIDDDVYFCRAEWKHQECVLDPPILEWKKGCLCQCIINPDIEFKVCPNCNGFFHVKCLDQEINSICTTCNIEL